MMLYYRYFNLVNKKIHEYLVKDYQITVATVNDLKQIAADAFSLPCDSIDLIICGKILNYEGILKDVDTDDEIIIHVLKINNEVPENKNKIVENLSRIFALKALLSNAKSRNILKHILVPDIIKHMIAADKELAKDDVAQRIIGDADLLYHICNSESILEICTKHRSLINACQYIAAELQNKLTDLPTVYSMHEEENIDAAEIFMPSSLFDNSLEFSNDQERIHFITQSQLASALAAVEAGLTDSNAGSTSGISSLTGQSSMETSNPPVNSDMVRLGVEQALAQSRATQELVSFTDERQSVNSDQLVQLQQMRELGFLDDVINLKALEMANGDLQNAIDLIYHLLDDEGG